MRKRRKKIEFILIITLIIGCCCGTPLAKVANQLLSSSYESLLGLIPSLDLRFPSLRTHLQFHAESLVNIGKTTPTERAHSHYLLLKEFCRMNGN